MIKIQCDVCKKNADDGYVSRKTWGTFPSLGYAENTIHVCYECDKKIINFINGITVEREARDEK